MHDGGLNTLKIQTLFKPTKLLPVNICTLDRKQAICCWLFLRPFMISIIMKH